MRAEPGETSKANLYSTPPGAFAPQEHAIDACVTVPTFPGASRGVPAHPNGGPIVRAGTDAALPVARLLAGLRDDGRDDVVDAQYNGSLGTRRDTQLLRWVLIFDREWSCKPLAITANAAALWLSDVPLRKLVTAAMAGYVDKRLVLNLTIGQMKHSRLNLTVADTKDHGRGQEGAEVVLDATRHG